MANGSEMRELSIRLGVINSKEFGTEITADIVSEGRTIKTYEVVVFKQVKKATVKKMAEEIKTNIDRNLKQGLKYTGGKVAALSKATIEAKKRKGRSQPNRVFLDSGVLFQSLRIVPTGTGYAITFNKTKYPKTKLYVTEVAQWLNDGTNKMPARPFFGITETQFNAIVNKYVGKRRINVQPTEQQIERAGELISLITGENPLRIEVLKQPTGKLIQDINLEQLYQQGLRQ